MPENKAAKVAKNRPPAKKRDRATEIANTFEWLITAFILAFVFRAFVMEAFRIPTGSMADTLKGAHFRLRCPQCGYAYDHGFVPDSPPYNMPPDTVPAEPVPIHQTRCPNCGYYTPGGEKVPVANGDRILVLKCIYQFVEPKRWDVIVFKNPNDPRENYIKRLIGLPGDNIEIVDGDVYINGRIARKPPEVQKELWMPVYDNDFQPVNPNEMAWLNETDTQAANAGDRARLKDHRWQLPFKLEGTAWTQTRDENPTRLVLDSPPDQTNTITYGTAPSANSFAAAYAYDEVATYRHMPECNDLMVRYYVQPRSAEGRVGITLTKNGVDYKAQLDLAGQMTLAKVKDGHETILKTRQVPPPRVDAFTLVRFANVDHQLLFEVNGTELSYDFGRSLGAMEHGSGPAAGAQIFGAGKLALSHLAVFRDIYYTGNGQSGPSSRAVKKGDPFQLNADEFFVLGDNSPNSYDGRWWSPPGPDKASKGWTPPRAGVVPRYYLVGKALFVYWPSGFEFPWPQGLKSALTDRSQSGNVVVRLLRGLATLRWVPNVGQMRFVYGGTGKTEPTAAEVKAAGPG